VDPSLGEKYWTAGRGTTPDNDFFWYVRQNYGTFVLYPIYYTNWDDGEPVGGNDQYCVAMSGTGYWEALRCSNDQLCAICEIDP